MPENCAELEPFSRGAKRYSTRQRPENRPTVRAVDSFTSLYLQFAHMPPICSSNRRRFELLWQDGCGAGCLDATIRLIPLFSIMSSLYIFNNRRMIVG